jgi:hypothetical protein
MTPVHDSLSLYKSDHTHTKGSEATVGYLNMGYPHSTTKKDKPLRTHAKGSAHEGRTSQNHARNASTTFRLARDLLDGTPRPQGNLRVVRP